MVHDKHKEEDRSRKETAPVKPDPETENTTDPQKKMEGPVSSLMRDTGHQFDSNKSKEEADRERDEHM